MLEENNGNEMNGFYRMRIQRTIPPVAALVNLKDILNSLDGIILGRRNINRLEKSIKEYFRVKHVFLVSSGKVALTLILLALKSKSAKKKVLIPAYTCFSVPSSIAKAGLEVSLCDINPSTLDFDYELLKKTVDEDTLCVIPNHLFGIPADVEKVKGVCSGQDVYIVEDAAQAMGGTLNGKQLGTIGDVGFFSLGRGKNITCGSGGIIITNSDQIAEKISEYYSSLTYPNRLRELRDLFLFIVMTIFIKPSLYWFPAGLRFLKLGQTMFHKDFPMHKLSGIKAGLLRHWKERLEQSNMIRQKTMVWFNERLKLQTICRDMIPVLRLPVLLNSPEERDRICSLSGKYGLGLSPMYPTPINEIEEIKETFNGKSFPGAGKVAEMLLTIPTHHLLSDQDREGICRILNNNP